MYIYCTILYCVGTWNDGAMLSHGKIPEYIVDTVPFKPIIYDLYNMEVQSLSGSCLNHRPCVSLCLVGRLR